MDANLPGLLDVQEGMKLVVREVGEEFGIRLLTTGDWTPSIEFSGLYGLGVTSLDEEGELNLPCSHDGFTIRHLLFHSVRCASQRSCRNWLCSREAS